MLQVWLTKLLLDAVTAGAGGVTAAVSWAMTLAAVYALTLVVPAALTPVQRVLSTWIEERAVAELDSRLIRAGTRLADLVRLERPAFQDQRRLVRQAASWRPARALPAPGDGCRVPSCPWSACCSCWPSYIPCCRWSSPRSACPTL